ncbi:alpha/beta hydrolase [Nonomuraea angiospora]|uniref:Pimeloyl-ACP methyl ester carboxylesterase n=1 Tax=Nonomuraea angiospora TaxID=46172 RepID=A0ABR9M009_9ACTN|nr:alpha/beta hydrolase [Nonomuraea angiospora]MBE1585930.1 pimeloyl-ACP methyl ester carboxylesterase [Nonomuraea angiospora]
MTALRRAAVAATTGMLAVACAGAQSVTITGSPAGLEPFYQQKLSWSGCGAGFQCATLKVPRDYAHPEGHQLRIAVIRLPANDGSRRIGSLVTNPGGPGASGVSFLRTSSQAFGEALRDRFDLVGFDPRGVGRSDPVRCLDFRQAQQRLLTDPPTTRGQINAEVRFWRAFTAACEARSGAVLPYVGTVDAARDMDVLRAALGDRRLTYIGFSYGTYLGAFYADQFPRNVRALVLDGASDPKLTGEEFLLGHAEGFETALRAFAAYCVRTAGCPLGRGSVDRAVGKVSGLQERAAREPLRNRADNRVPVDDDGVTQGVYTALYNRSNWPTLRQALAQAIEDGDGTGLYRLGYEQEIVAPFGALQAVNCVDKPFPADLAAVRNLAGRAERVAPHFGAFVVWPWLACAYWPVKPARQPRAVTATGAPPILVVGTTRDPATPYRWAQSLANQLTSGVLLTYDGDGHTAYLSNTETCIRGPVEQYLISAQPPKRGMTCEQTPLDPASKGSPS